MTTVIETAPAMEVPPQDIDALLEDLRPSHAIYRPLFQRREQRTWAANYLQGLLLEIPRKSIEPMILALAGADANAVRAMQQFIRDGTGDDTPILRRHWQEVDPTLGEADGVLTVDGSDFLKQGQESVGVKRQYGGEVGKRANCQADVLLGYASRHGYTLLDRRLYLPREWVEEETYAERRRKCGVPADGTCQTKLALASNMSDAVCQAKALRGRWVTCDEACGRDTVLLDQVASSGLWYWAEVPHDTRVWCQRPPPPCRYGRAEGASPVGGAWVLGTRSPKPSAVWRRLGQWGVPADQRGQQGADGRRLCRGAGGCRA